MTTNPIMVHFLESEKGRAAYALYRKCPTKSNEEILNRYFQLYYVKVKMIAYFAKSLSFEAMDYDKRRRQHENRYSLLLDAPIKDENMETYKEWIVAEEPSYYEHSLHLEEVLDRQDIWEAMKLLTKNQKRTLEYAYIKDMKDTEIASEFGISQQAVSKTRQSALKKLRRRLKVG
ncbi:hypothetical protein Q75_00740 [Bacillus coahuilensis p1.1.43]|uniref:RNA polymerase sigma factor 70 region 4 type 2 domain-containing protein n=1 Tax=Bacillus coahuilensis p1.1.43 TaxID=1150625 RepID=A0A147KCQ9_9BACI|nr:sigma-70 family RNA polymerase sigma factor [Bacillus coahuilensis]KUP09477.1 hypothetical protein Q75_00740 [Bacillus coahuilensis p1.1.43]